MMLDRKLRFGMIGGGQGAFIGAVHRIAAQLDQRAELVAGAFSSDPARALASGAQLNLDPARVYATYQAMVEAEAQMPRERRLDFVIVVTPNHEHFAPAKLLLQAGFNVVCDKPVTLDHAQAVELAGIVARTRKVFVLTHNYTGNAMVKQARALVREGELGAVRKVVVEYSQGWLATDVRSKQSQWRTDPKCSGAAGCLSDIGTHAYNLVGYVTGLRVDELCASFATFVPGRQLEDDANILLRFHGGARGVLHCSQIAIGEENNLNIRVYGDRGCVEWHQEQPNDLIVKYLDAPCRIWRRGNPYIGDAAARASRIPAGHPEGFLEAFANIYAEAFRAIAAEVQGVALPEDCDFPTIHDGVDGMRFIEAAVASNRLGSKWVAL